MEIILDKELEKAELGEFRPVKFSKDKEVRSEIGGDTFHRNYLEYLAACWRNHYGAVISPDAIWNVIISELATVVKGDPEKFRDLFTTSDEKTDIIVMTADPEVLPLSEIERELKKLVPSNTDLFIPRFSTTGDDAIFAHQATFADMVSPYYNYGMMMCGIPSVKIEGTLEDWCKLCDNLIGIQILFNDHVLNNYFLQVLGTIGSIRGMFDNENESMDIWNDFFRLDRCGSGSQVEVVGWINNLFLEKPRPAYIENYPSCISKVEYKNITTDKEFELYSGLFSSTIEGDYLVPSFGYVVYETTKAEVTA